MASDMRIKVSEDKVRETVETLNSKIMSMEDHLQQLVGYRGKLEQLYKGPAAKIAMDVIKKKEREAANSIEKFKKQKEKLQAYLDTMNTIDAKVTANYEAALNKTNELFK